MGNRTIKFDTKRVKEKTQGESNRVMLITHLINEDFYETILTTRHVIRNAYVTSNVCNTRRRENDL